MELSKKSHISERMRLLEARLGPKKDEQGCDENRPPIRHVPMYDDLDMFEEGGSTNISRRCKIWKYDKLVNFDLIN